MGTFSGSHVVLWTDEFTFRGSSNLYSISEFSYLVSGCVRRTTVSLNSLHYYHTREVGFTIYSFISVEAIE